MIDGEANASGRWTVWPAPAKLNLFLHVVGRRDDGYHELQTVFQLLDRVDQVALRVREDGRIVRETNLAGVPESQDLTLRAARLLQVRTGVSLGVDVRVRKFLPAGGGLGGGSSDAATVLVALNFLWGCGLDENALARLGRELGADVPVFIRGRTAWAEGVGEQLTPLALDAASFLVLDPGVHVSTAEIFNAAELTRSTPRRRIADFRAEPCRNDCEPVVVKGYPPVGRALEWLGQYGAARMTGTGGCCFVAFTGDDASRQASAAWADRPAGWNGFVARGVAVSPLRQALARYRSGRATGSSTGA